MATLTIRLPDDKHYRLKELAQARGISVNKLIEELSTIALAEFADACKPPCDGGLHAHQEDAYCRFRAMAAKGNVEEGLKLLEKLDALTN